MAKTNNLHDFLLDLANTIRTKKDIPSTTLIDPQDFSDEIESIETGKPEQEKQVTLTSNGTTNVTPDEGYVLSKVTATVALPIYNGEMFTVYGIDATASNGTIGGEDYIIDGYDAVVTITANTGFILPDTVTVTGANYEYTKTTDTTATITLTEPISDVTVEVICLLPQLDGADVTINGSVLNIVPDDTTGAATSFDITDDGTVITTIQREEVTV